LLHDVSWENYIKIGDALEDRPALRLTYDRGSLEIMVTSSEHEGYKSRLSRLFEALTEEMNVAVKGFGSMTHQREDLRRALEPDECYYLANHARMRGVKRLDLTRDPPPDLVLEMEVTCSALDRMDIYATLGVPEVWRFDGETVTPYQLVEGQYERLARSPTFPMIPLEELVRFVRLGESEDDTTMVRAFRSWVRKQLVVKKRGKPKRR